MELWVEANIIPLETEGIEDILLQQIKPLVNSFKEKKLIMTWHFLREYAPLGIYHIRLRFRAFNEESKGIIRKKIVSVFDPLKGKIIKDHYFGCEGVGGREYLGDEGDYGERSWEVVQKYLEFGSELALIIFERRPLERTDRFNLSRFFHALANQLGHTIGWEVEVLLESAQSLAARIL